MTRHVTARVNYMQSWNQFNVSINQTVFSPRKIPMSPTRSETL